MHLHRLFLFATAAIAETLSSASQPIAPSSPTSNVTGLYFDRFITIWLENTDYEKAAGDRACPILPLRIFANPTRSKPKMDS